MMEWKSFVDRFGPMTCIMSVEKTPGGGYGAIRIVTGNQGYIDTLALAAGGVDLGSDKRTEFVPNSEYTRYIPKDLNLEDACYRCAVLKQPMRNYVRATRYPFDIYAYMLPLEGDDEAIAYCTFSQVFVPKTVDNLMAKTISLETAMDVIGTCVKLRGGTHFHATMGEVIEDIRVICAADYCCVLLLDERERRCSVLGEAKAPDSNLAWIGTYLDDGFYDMAESWLDTIGGSFCLMVRDPHEMEFIRERNPKWHESLMRAGAKTLIIFPLFAQGQFLGYIWAMNFDTENVEHISDTLELAAHFIAAEISSSRFAGREGSADGGALRPPTVMEGLRNDLDLFVSHLNDQANSMITAMASDYRSVYHVNLDKNDCVCYRYDSDDAYQSPQGVHFPFLERFTWYANNIVTEGYREGFLQFIDPDNIRAGLATQRIIAYRYLAKRDGREYYEMIRMAGVRRAEERDDHIVHAIGLGFTEIDAEVREAMAKNEALAAALDAAQDASRAKTAFLSTMSHEIRTPMNAIIGLDKLALMDEGLSEQTRDHLEKIGESANHLLGLINDVLDMSRIESGRMVLRKEEFSFAAMLEQINLMVMPQCADKGLAYECKVEGPVDASYIGDDTKLKEVLLNILSNAVKFTDAPGSVTLLVERAAVFGDRSTLRFHVKDTGIGMDADYIPKIFDAFSQEDSSRKNKYGSTGLGMAITKGIVEMMNGTISVESEKGAGTEFTVVVTMRRGEQAGFQDAKAPLVEDLADTGMLAGCRLLLAEDIEINAEIMMDLLEMEGIEAEHAENGQIAVEMFASHEPGYYDAILMDVRMPVMDGLEAAAAIRALDRADAQTVPIVALTANAFDEDVQRSMQAGMNAHLSKPVESDLLLQTLCDLVSKAGAARS